MKRYLLIITTLTLGICLTVGLFNYRVDPFGVYQFKQANADSLSRIDQFYHMRITKPWHVLQAKPTAIVVGTSRSATVIPQHPTWAPHRSYNLSVPGLTVYEMYRFIEHAQASSPLNKLMIGLDFEAFILPEPQTRTSFEESRMARSAADLASPRFLWQLVSDVRDTLFSLPGFARSMAALTGSGKAGRRYFKDGTWISTTSAATGRGGYSYVGRSNIFDLRHQQLSIDSNLETFADLLRFAHQHNIDTRLFITPEHVFLVDLWWRLGYGDLWSDFHRRLVAVNNAVATEMGVSPFPIVGFNQVRGVATVVPMPSHWVCDFEVW